MSDDLIELLRNERITGAMYLRLDAAQALTEARAEIQRLQERVLELKHGVKDQMEEAAYHKQKRDAAESELSTLRARVRDVVGPFAAWISAVDAHSTAEFPDHAAIEIRPRDDKSPVKITGADLRAARQLDEDLK